MAENQFSGFYLAPEAEVIEIRTQAVLCVSGDIPNLTNDDGVYKF